MKSLPLAFLARLTDSVSTLPSKSRNSAGCTPDSAVARSRKGCQGLPLTRAQLYAAEQPRPFEAKQIHAVR